MVLYRIFRVTKNEKRHFFLHLLVQRPCYDYVRSDARLDKGDIYALMKDIAEYYPSFARMFARVTTKMTRNEMLEYLYTFMSALDGVNVGYDIKMNKYVDTSDGSFIFYKDMHYGCYRCENEKALDYKKFLLQCVEEKELSCI